MPRFKDFFLESFGNKEISLDEDILNEIKVSSESLKNIFNKKGFLKWFRSLISNNQLLLNITNLIIDSFINKIDFIKEKMIEEFDKYINKMIISINTRTDIAALTFTNEQKEKWEVIKEMYEIARANLISIKFEISNNK